MLCLMNFISFLKRIKRYSERYNQKREPHKIDPSPNKGLLGNIYIVHYQGCSLLKEGTSLPITPLFGSSIINSSFQGEPSKFVLFDISHLT